MPRVPDESAPQTLTSADREDLLARTRVLHEAIRAGVGVLLERARAEGRPELANRPGVEGAGDLGYALDDVADAPLASFLADLATRHPTTLIAEGPGVLRGGDGAAGAPLRVIVDPVDGTRPLMHDLRPAWCLTGIAPDGGEATRLSDIEVAVQTELPTTWSGVYHVLTAIRGQGATLARHDVTTGAELDRRPLRVDATLELENGYFAFTRFLPAERPLVARLEQAFLAAVERERLADPRLLYEDQVLCTAGQLFWLVTGRYRLLVDLRAWLRRAHGTGGFTAKPYDLATLLVFREAGLPVFDAEGAPLDGPLDTETPLDVVAYGNATLAARLAPHLQAARATLAG